jgi:GNAT superfamily N-acetyltransferase
MTALASIRRASPRERREVVATVTAAFATDPAWRFITNDEYGRLAHHFAQALFELRVRRGNVWISDDAMTVAMWDGPDHDAPAREVEQVWARYVAIAGEGAHARLVAYREAVAAAFPPQPVWYLGVLATHPAHQRTGLASAVLAPVMREADEAGIACCLETSTEDNRRFYERRGFTEATEAVLPGGPRTWLLRRPEPL